MQFLSFTAPRSVIIVYFLSAVAVWYWDAFCLSVCMPTARELSVTENIDCLFLKTYSFSGYTPSLNSPAYALLHQLVFDFRLWLQVVHSWKQGAQLSQRNRATLYIIRNVATYKKTQKVARFNVNIVFIYFRFYVSTLNDVEWP